MITDIKWQTVELLGHDIVTAIAPDEARELARLAAGKNVLEIGGAHGYSAIIMAIAGGKVTSVDPHKGETWLGNTLGSMKSQMELHGVSDKIEIVQELDDSAMPRLYNEGKRYDLIFLDGSGEYDKVIFDIEWAKKLLAPKGTIAIHDYDSDNHDKRKPVDACFPKPDRTVHSLFVISP